jgi:hypothetical protein
MAKRNTFSTVDAFEAGYDAYRTGVAWEDNPYRIGSDAQYSWDEGWSQAQLEEGQPSSAIVDWLLPRHAAVSC